MGLDGSVVPNLRFGKVRLDPGVSHADIRSSSDPAMAASPRPAWCPEQGLGSEKEKHLVYTPTPHSRLSHGTTCIEDMPRPQVIRPQCVFMSGPKIPVQSIGRVMQAFHFHPFQCLDLWILFHVNLPRITATPHTHNLDAGT